MAVLPIEYFLSLYLLQSYMKVLQKRNIQAESRWWSVKHTWESYIEFRSCILQFWDYKILIIFWKIGPLWISLVYCPLFCFWQVQHTSNAYLKLSYFLYFQIANWFLFSLDYCVPCEKIWCEFGYNIILHVIS